jgi:hypothetical protein
MEYLIWDPWWFTPDKQGTNDPEQVILWGCGLGFVAKSEDAGKSWQNLTQNIDTPPNTWTDTPAPTVADITFSPIHADIHTKDEFTLLANFESAGLERAWFVKTEDDGVTWSWTPLSISVSDGGKIYAGASTMDCASGGANHFSVSSTNRIAGLPDDTPGFFTRVGSNPGGCNFNLNFYVDLGLDVTTPSSIEARVKGDNPIVGAVSVDGGNSLSGPWTNFTNNANWYATGITEFEWRGDYEHAGGPWRYLRFEMGNGPGGSNGNKIEIDTVRLDAASASIPEVRGIWLEIDNEDGSLLWITTLSDGSLTLQQRDNEAGTVSTNYDLGAATTGEVDAKTYIAYCFTPGFDNDILFVFGRMQSPLGLANPEHIILTTDGGDTWSSVGDSATWGADHIGAFHSSDTTTLYAFRNGASRALYRSIDGGTTWSSLSSTPFDVEPGGLSVHPDGRMLIINTDAGPAMAAYAEGPDYSEWIDATGSPAFPQAGGGANAVIWVT